MTKLTSNLEAESVGEASGEIHRRYWNGLDIGVLTAGSWGNVAVAVPLHRVERSYSVQGGEAVYS